MIADIIESLPSANGQAETWRPVVGWEKVYGVSDLGRVRGPKGTTLKPRLINGGYQIVTLSAGRVRKTCTVHGLVAAAFIGPRPNRHDVNHIDGVKTNNCATNLEYLTRSDNHRHAFAIGLKTHRGEHDPMAKLNATQVSIIRHLKGRVPNKAIARMFDISPRAIFSIFRGETWAGVPC